MDLTYVLVVVVAVVFFASADNSDVRTAQDHKKIYCGQHLSQALSAVCHGNYNTLTKKQEGKPNHSPEPFGQSTTHNFFFSVYNRWDQKRPDYPYKSKQAASSLITGFRRRRKRGVFNECCEKPCSHEELSTYCGSR